MLKSMTGYGQAEGAVDDMQVRVEITSLNNRFLLIEPDLPTSLERYRSPLEKLVKSELSRGTVRVRIYLPELNGSGHEIDEACLEKYWNSMSRAADRLGLPQGVTIGELAGLPGVIHSKPRVSATEEQWQQVASSVTTALQMLVEDRSREGSSTREDLLRLGAALIASLNELKALLPEADAKRHGRYKERIEKVAGKLVTEDMVAREAAVLSEKHDISEEVHRLQAHLDEYARLVETGGAVGKKLEFLSQEMHRETVTICNKADDVNVSRVAMEIRAGVQGIREQVMNVE